MRISISIATPHLGPLEKNIELTDFDKEHLSSKDIKFWTNFFAEYPDLAAKVLKFLRLEKDKNYTHHSIYNNDVLNTYDLKQLQKYVGSYEILYRGFDPLEFDLPSKSKGDRFVYVTADFTYWSPSRREADSFAQAGGILISAKIPKSKIAIDLHKIPFSIGPAGKEKEVIVKPGSYKVEVLRVYDYNGEQVK